MFEALISTVHCQESLLPYAKKQLKLAKMSFDLFGALSPTSEQPDNNLRDAGEEWVKKTDGDGEETKTSAR